MPLAGWIARATEHLADKAGEGVGGPAECHVRRRGRRHAGSIVGNILLVLGASMLAGGLRHSEQTYNAAGARSEATLLTLAAIALILPYATYNNLVGALEHGLWFISISISIVLLVVYVFSPGVLPGSHSTSGSIQGMEVERSCLASQ